MEGNPLGQGQEARGHSTPLERTPDTSLSPIVSQSPWTEDSNRPSGEARSVLNTLSGRGESTTLDTPCHVVHRSAPELGVPYKLMKGLSAELAVLNLLFGFKFHTASEAILGAPFTQCIVWGRLLYRRGRWWSWHGRRRGSPGHAPLPRVTLGAVCSTVWGVC